MPAGIPGSTPVQNSANPSAGAAIMHDLLSGPKGSPFDNDRDWAAASGYFPSLTGSVVNANSSTGALATGIGFGPTVNMPGIAAIPPSFNDDYTPGVTTPAGTASPNSVLMYLGGGRCNANSGGLAAPNPYTAGFGIGAAGNGGTRDAGAGPTVYTGFAMKLVTAAGAVANGAAIETGFTNRSGGAMVTGQSQFGVATAASAAVTLAPSENFPDDDDDPKSKDEKSEDKDEKPADKDEKSKEKKPLFNPFKK